MRLPRRTGGVLFLIFSGDKNIFAEEDAAAAETEKCKVHNLEHGATDRLLVPKEES